MYNKKSFENLLKQLSNKRLVMLLPIHTPVAQIKKKMNAHRTGLGHIRSYIESFTWQYIEKNF